MQDFASSPSEGCIWSSYDRLSQAVDPAFFSPVRSGFVPGGTPQARNFPWGAHGERAPFINCLLSIRAVRSVEQRHRDLATQIGHHLQVPTSDGRMLVMPRYTEPESGQKVILEKLRLALPAQPPPRIRAGK